VDQLRVVLLGVAKGQQRGGQGRNVFGAPKAREVVHESAQTVASLIIDNCFDFGIRLARSGRVLARFWPLGQGDDGDTSFAQAAGVCNFVIEGDLSFDCELAVGMEEANFMMENSALATVVSVFAVA
jgi:hypothetical protein